MKNILQQNFFNRSTIQVAQELLGKYIIRRIDGQEIALMLTEVEAYDGFDDKASHASRGKTDRNEIMFGSAGHFYLYLIYGMYWMLNIVAGPKDYPAAILIRGAEDIVGPGRLTKKLQLDRSFNAKPVMPTCDLWVEDRGVVVQKKEIIKTPRIGVAYAGKVWAQKPYRFLLQQK